MTDTMMEGFFRVCAKLYAPEPTSITDDAAVFVPIFHDWIREQALDAVLFDVADYAHVPDSPGIMLVTHEASFALDRSDERFGLLGQRRAPIDGDAVAAIVRTVRLTLEVAEKLRADPRVGGALDFDTSSIRIESNDRLRAPNSEEGFATMEPIVRRAMEEVHPAGVASITRIQNDPRDRLSLMVVMDGGNLSLNKAA